MGVFWSAFKGLINSNKDQRILMVGLDAAGKTTILYKFRLGETVTTIPTIGFNVETFDYKNLHFTMWDVGGQERIRPLWRHYYHGVNAVIYVVDTSDRERIEESAEELNKMLSEELLHDACLLVYANKQDLPHAVRVNELVERLELNKLKNRTWHVQSCIGTTGEGLYEGLDWLSRTLLSQKK